MPRFIEKGRVNAAKETPALLRSGQPRGRGKAAQVPLPQHAQGFAREKLVLGP